jgi:hypothetical protein
VVPQDFLVVRKSCGPQDFFLVLWLIIPPNHKIVWWGHFHHKMLMALGFASKHNPLEQSVNKLYIGAHIINNF